MANPGPNRVKLVKANIERLQASLRRLKDQCGHWSQEWTGHCDAAAGNLAWLVDFVKALPADYVPPRKPPVRSYTTLKLDDTCKIADRVAKHSPSALVGAVLVVKGLEGDLAHVQRVEAPGNDVVYAVRRSALRPMKPVVAVE